MLLNPLKYICLAAMLLLTIAGRSAVGQSDRVQEEFNELIDLRSGLQLPENVRIRVTQQVQFQPLGQRELESLTRRAQVEAQARLDLATYTRIKEHGSDETVTDLMFGSDDRWRLGADHSTNPIAAWDDFALGKDGPWILTQRSLQYADQGVSNEVFDPSMRMVLVREWLRTAATGLVEWPDTSRILDVAVQDNGQFSILVEHAKGKSRLIGSLRPALGSGGIDLRIEKAESETRAGVFETSVRYEDWRFNPVLEREVAHRIIHLEPGGREFGRIQFLEIVPLKINIDEITARPRADAEDPLRGAPTFTSITDHSRSERTAVDPDSRELAGTIASQSEPKRNYRAAGFIGLILAIGILSVVRIANTSRRGNVL